MATLAAVALFFLFSRCTHGDAAGAAETRGAEMITVAVPEPVAGTKLVARVVVGPLSRGARVIVLLDGEVVGSIAPYGGRAAASGGSYTIPLPDHAGSRRELTFQVEIREKRGGAPRPPHSGESIRIELVRAATKPQ